jgi:hypothetical protein
MQLLTPAQQRAEQLGWIIDQLTMAGIAKGQSYGQERLRINAEDLIDIPREALAIAFGKARRELDFMPGVSEIRRLALADEAGQTDAAMRASWDVLIAFVGKYVGSDCEGNYGPEHGSWGPVRSAGKDMPAAYPVLEQRILDIVRRTGGWRQYKCMSEKDYPFQQRRFFEEYRAWVATERALPAIAGPCTKQLARSAAKERSGETTGELVDFATVVNRFCEASNHIPGPEHITRLKASRQSESHLLIPPVHFSPEEIAARRQQEQEEIKRYQQKA